MLSDLNLFSIILPETKSFEVKYFFHVHFGSSIIKWDINCLMKCEYFYKIYLKAKVFIPFKLFSY